MRFAGTREEFAAARKSVLDRAETRLAGVIGRALTHYGEHDWYEPIVKQAIKVYSAMYEEEAGEKPSKSVTEAYGKKLSTSLAKTKTPTKTTASTLKRYVATNAVNAATVHAADADPEELVLEWVTMHDSHVRETHKAADGQRRKEGEPFHVGDSEMMHPGDTSAPPDEWIGCRCVARADFPGEASISALTAAATDTSNLTVVVALPHADDPVNEMGPEQSHITLAFLGNSDEIANPEAIDRQVAQVAAKHAPFGDQVSGRGTLGSDEANVLFLDGDGSASVRSDLINQPDIMAAHDAAPQFPTWNPHLTLGYPGDQIADGKPESIQFDRLALWHGDSQTEYPLGGDVTAPTDQEPTDEAPVDEAETANVSPPAAIPWHGVAAPEGAMSGDGRGFKAGSLRNRDLPLPLTWQKASAEGHDGSVVIGRIDGFNRVEAQSDSSNLIEFWGVMLANPEADEVIGQLAAFGKFGVSVDIDDATFDVDEAGDRPAVWFSDARICSASVVSIPAFAEAFITLGEHPSLQETPTEPAPEEMSLAGGEEFARGPGWVTDPTDTKRIHDYWTVPGKPGYAKIAWGAGGDFDRCRVEVGKYLEPQYVNGTCAQWHHDALGIWPSTHAKALGGGGAHSLDDAAWVARRLAGTRASASLNLVASGAWTPPAAWFSDLTLTELTRTTYVEHPEGTEVYGHMGEWRTCHLGIPGVCTEMPPSTSPEPYSVFHTVGGGLMTDEGLIDVGQLTLGGGHADTRLGLRAALAHYDDVSTVVADVRVGEDEFGIWFHGWMRPSVTEEQRVAFRACTLSGDWRMVKGHQELMLAHAVNMGGFPIVPQTSVIDGQQVALVAAGAIQDGGQLTAGFTMEDVARIVSDTINEREAQAARRKLIEGIVSKHGADPASRMSRLREQFTSGD